MTTASQFSTDTALFSSQLRVISAGLSEFAGALPQQATPVLALNWQPPAEGEAHLVELLKHFYGDQQLVERIDRANAETLQRILDSNPHERPARRNWTMVACERSRQIHRHFYNDDAPCVEMCPRQIVRDSGELTLLKCCLLENHVEAAGSCVIVPWGSNLAQVKEGLETLVKIHQAQKGDPVAHESLA